MATAPDLDMGTNHIVSTSIEAAVAQNPSIVLIEPKRFEQLFEHIRREVDAFTPDTSTEKGRKAIASLAFKVARTKTAIDDAGKKLNEDARARIAVVDASRRDVREKLDALKDEVRKPLTDWEIAETARLAECKLVITNLQLAAAISPDDTAVAVRERAMRVWNEKIDPERFGELTEAAAAAKDSAVAALRAALVRLEREEADRAELARLRAENEAREAREREEREARDAEEREAAEARQAEERRTVAEKAEAERLAQAERDAADRARRDAEAAAAREAAERERAHQAELAAERRRAQEAEAARQAEADRISREERARKDAEAKAVAEQAAREADLRHRTKVKAAAKSAIMTCGVDEETARKIVTLIVAGEVPAVTLRF